MHSMSSNVPPNALQWIPDDLFGFSGFLRFKANTLFAANLLAVQPGGQKALTGALVQIGNFFFGLLKGQFDLLLCQGHQILVDALQDEVHICPCHGNAAGQGFFVGLGVDVVLFQEHQPDALMVEVFVQSKTFFCIRFALCRVCQMCQVFMKLSIYFFIFIPSTLFFLLDKAIG